MRVAVFMKYVLDPEILSRDFAVNPMTGLPITTFPSFQFDQYDRIALEIALKFRDVTPDAKVLSVCTGPDAAQDGLRGTLALKVEEAILLETAQPPNDYDRAAAFAEWVGTNAPDNGLRKSKLQDVMRAQGLPITRVSADVIPQSDKGRGLKTLRAYIPSVTSVCEFIDGDDAQEKAAELARRLRLLLKRAANTPVEVERAS